MIARIVPVVLLLCATTLFAQVAPENPNGASGANLLAKHLSAAETYQIAGDLDNARVENEKVVGIGLEESANLLIREGQYQKATLLLKETLSYRDTFSSRLNLAVSYLRQNDTENALEQAKIAVSRNGESSYARSVLGNIHYVRGEFALALPHLEKAFIKQQDFDVARALALTYLHLKEAQRAKLLFEEMQTALGKKNAPIHIFFGQAYERTGYHREAEAEFKKATSIDPSLKRASFFLGYIILQHGGADRLQESREAFEQELKLDPEDFFSNFFAGVVAVSSNDQKSAIKYLEKALTIDPTSEEAYLFLGQAYFDSGDFKRTEPTLRKSIELDAKKPTRGIQARRAHYMLSRVLLKTDREQEARKHLAIARQLQRKSLSDARGEISRIMSQVAVEKISEKGNKPSLIAGEGLELDKETKTLITQRRQYLSNILAQAFHNIGVIAIQKQDVEKSLANFEKAFEWNEAFPGLRRNLGIISFRAAKYPQVIKVLLPHLKAAPDDLLTRRMLAVSQYITADFQGCVKTLAPVDTKLQDDPELSYFYGVSLAKLQDFKKAQAHFDQMAKRYESDPKNLFYPAQGFMFLGDYNRSVAEFDRILAIDKSMSKANYFKGQSLIRLSKYEEAEKAFRNELNINPLDELSKYHLAITLIERRIKKEESISLLKDAIRYRSNYADARYQLGKIYLENGKTNEAISEFETAIQIEPKKDYIHYQLSIAYRKASRMKDAANQLKIYQKIKAENRKNADPQPMGTQSQ